MSPADLVARVLDLVDAQYVIAERSADLRHRLETRSAEGAYDDLAPPDLAESITSDLREAANDVHLRLVHREVAQPLREEATEETPEEVAELRRVARLHNFGCAEVRRLAGNVGYWRITELYDLIDGAGPTFVASMRLLVHTDALIVDLRRNTGGDPAAVALVASFFFDVEPVHLNTLQGRIPGATRQWWTTAWLECERYLEKAVYVLVDERTFSAAEELAYDLQALGRATIVGRPTAGAAHLREQFQIDEHWFVNIPTHRPVNPTTGTSWEGCGVTPDVEVAEGSPFELAYESAVRSLLEEPDLAEDRAAELRDALARLSDETVSARP